MGGDVRGPLDGVLIRPFESDDAPALGRIVGDMWPDGVVDPVALRWKGLADLYFFLERSSLALVAEVDGGPAGIAVARDPFLGDGGFGDPDRFEAYQTELSRYEEGRRALQILAIDRAVGRELLEEAEEPYKCEIMLFICDGSVRGRGVGGRLFSTLLDELHDRGVEGVHLFTDTTCDWGFYDYHGFTLRAERELPPDLFGAGTMIFLYDKPLVEDSLEDL